MKLVLVCGPWSSGTTAVAGMLDALGLDGCGPYFRTNDERTRNSFESLAFREVIDGLASDQTLKPTAPAKAAVAALTVFRAQLEAARGGAEAAAKAAPMFLKYPLSALLIPQICRVFDTRLVYVLRPVKDIEATRERRKWGEQFGAKGAQVIYSRMFQVLVEMPFPTLVLRYPELRANPLPHTKQLAAYSGLKKITTERLEAAASFVRRS
jgi:hypothetical protein